MYILGTLLSVHSIKKHARHVIIIGTKKDVYCDINIFVFFVLKAISPNPSLNHLSSDTNKNITKPKFLCFH